MRRRARPFLGRRYETEKLPRDVARNAGLRLIQGISLSLAQYGDLLKAIPGLNAELKKKGQSFDDLDDACVPVAKTKTSKKAHNLKANIETTSEEED